MRRRKKEPLILDEERDVRENIVRYDDEGGGEEDTEAFDMVALRNLNVIRDHKARRDVTPEVPIFFSSRPPPYKAVPDNGIFREFIWDRLKDADVDPSAPPYDSLQTYAFEGSGSVAESLSSLESLSTDSDQNYDYLSDWGPRFKKLADLYGHTWRNGGLSECHVSLWREEWQKSLVLQTRRHVTLVVTSEPPGCAPTRYGSAADSGLSVTRRCLGFDRLVVQCNLQSDVLSGLRCKNPWFSN
ncbi:cadherin-7-like [Arapaima gigas]